MKQAILPLFLPHAACPHRCIFCNQEIISRSHLPQHPERQLRNALQNLPECYFQAEIAFFGGSFTALPEPIIRYYLDIARQLRQEDSRIIGIRLSTRPDCISPPILALLREYEVTTVELGVQSMCDQVLEASERGHRVEHTIRAMQWLKQESVQTVLQFMPGLPKDTKQTIWQTGRAIADLKPDAVRIYPCVVLAGTRLEQMYREGIYRPLDLDQAVEISTDLSELFQERNIQILRIGLHSDIDSGQIIAGPFHPAFGELVRQRLCRRKMEKTVTAGKAANGELQIFVPVREHSQWIGKKKENLLYLEKKYGIRVRIKGETQIP